MATNLPVAKTLAKVSEYIRAGSPFIISIKTLAISLPEYSDQQFELLCSILKTNTTVVTLDIDNNKTNDNKDKHFQLIGEILQTNKSITNLFLRGFNLKDDYMKSVFMALSQNKTIKKLLIYSTLRSQGFYYLSEALKVNSTISYIAYNGEINIDDQSAKYLNTALKINTSVRTLILKAFIKCVDLLSEAIMHNKTLRLLHLNVDSRTVTDEEIEIFCRSIEQNVGLETLILNMTTLYASRLLKCFTINNTISNLGYPSYGSRLALTPEDETWIRQIKGLTYMDGSHELLDSVLLENKRVVKRHREDLKILLFNIARSQAALELLPIEIWQNIFTFLVYPGIHVGDLAEIIFPMAWTLDLTGEKKQTNNNLNYNNRNAMRNNNNNSSRFCSLL